MDTSRNDERAQEIIKQRLHAFRANRRQQQMTVQFNNGKWYDDIYKIMYIISVFDCNKGMGIILTKEIPNSFWCSDTVGKTSHIIIRMPLCWSK